MTNISNIKQKIALPLVILSTIILLVLGTWQVYRLLWKLELIHKIELRLTTNPEELKLEQVDINKDEYKLVLIYGHFLNNKEKYLYMGSVSPRGGQGYDLLTPFKTNQGKIILVDMGWVPYGFKDQSKRNESLSPIELKLVGMLHKSEKKAYFTPDNDSLKNMWFFIDVKSMLSDVQHDEKAEDFFVRLVKDPQNIKQDIYPIYGDKTVRYRNDHLEYAIIWYSLALILVIMYVVFAKRKRKLGIKS